MFKKPKFGLAIGEKETPFQAGQDDVHVTMRVDWDVIRASACGFNVRVSKVWKMSDLVPCLKNNEVPWDQWRGIFTKVGLNTFFGLFFLCEMSLLSGFWIKYEEFHSNNCSSTTEKKCF